MYFEAFAAARRLRSGIRLNHAVFHVEQARLSRKQRLIPVQSRRDHLATQFFDRAHQTCNRISVQLRGRIVQQQQERLFKVRLDNLGCRQDQGARE